MTVDKLSLAFVFRMRRHGTNVGSWWLCSERGVAIPIVYGKLLYQRRIAVSFPLSFLSTCLVFFDVELLA